MDRIHQLRCERETIALHLADGQGGDLALFLQRHEVPAALIDELLRGGVGAMLLKGVSTRRGGGRDHRIAHRERQLRERARQVVGVHVAVADD